MDDDELKKDDELNDVSEDEDSTDDDIILGGKGKKPKGLPEDDLSEDIESIDDLAALEDEDEPYDDVDLW
jgi:hypothetical protein